MSIELAWAAGFFDGEGTIGNGRDVRHGGSVNIQMSVVQAGTVDNPPDSLVRFRDAVGGGKIYHRKTNKGRFGSKPLWAWRATGNEAESIFNMLRPFLCLAKLDQGASALAFRHEWLGLKNDRMRFCIRGHEFTEDNIYVYKNRPTPARLCRACNRERERKLRASRRAAAITVAGEGQGG